ncbi:hypothetical protein LWF15_32935 [Kineosporia rhizophila]|uniref:hypothetical protein n=1 Tax=Kineosporia TaxID=49184 RepID=UPI000AA1F186|nr:MULTISPECIES: hypothetical protein [Kineosporia]MCE0540310.1 hypothetical protein [Kineosporia rhizophila]GLY16323.1 hypothetical protein Kisp01_33380 [Kineosporia sp. NBRC 101677]
MTWLEWWARLTQSQPWVPAQQTTASFLLPSDVPDLPFRAQVTIDWPALRSDAPAVDRSEVIRHLRVAAGALTEKYSVVFREEAEYDLHVNIASRCGSSAPCAVTVQLQVDEEVRQAALRHQELRRAQVFEEEKQQIQVRQWENLQKNVFHDPLRIRMWWLKGDPERLEQLIDGDTIFERAAQALSPPASRPSEALNLVRMIESFWSKLSDEQRTYLVVDRLDAVFRNFEQPELADELQHGFPPAPEQGGRP